MVGVGEDQTSRQATGWSLPALLYHSFPSLRLCLPASTFSFFFLPSSSSTVLSTSFFVLFVPLAEPSCLLLRHSYPSPLYYSYFYARVRSAMCLDDHPHARFFSVCARASGRACNARDMQSPRGPREEICQAADNIVSRGGKREREREAVLLLNFYTVWLRRRENSRVP